MHKHTFATRPIPGRKARPGRRRRKSLVAAAPTFHRAERIVRLSRQRIATELWDLFSPTSPEAAGAIALSVSGSRLFAHRLAVDRPPRSSGWRKALLFNRIGVAIAVLYALYLLVSLAITLPVLLVAFVLDLWDNLLRRIARRR